MSKNDLKLYKNACAVARRFRDCETSLILVIQEVDRARLYFKYECECLVWFVVEHMGLSRTTASYYCKIARAAYEFAPLQAAIAEGKVHMTNARKIAGILTEENAEAWVEAACQNSSRDLEFLIASF